jgi:hypothetical protein
MIWLHRFKQTESSITAPKKKRKRAQKAEETAEAEYNYEKSATRY